ncbi:MAG: hypothetical protein P3B76_11050 [Gemmatimonadota bacterium]|nr:hypothetical protein [Gemmatimonadota bacterium]MDQ8168407.1 hypothetical protein [Gemmatimonadota bacterium]MDQ8173209.1 hypothetical protein [Gemmatimonadota bacterium]
MPTLPSVGPVEPDSGPPVRLDSAAQGTQFVMTPKPGDQIDALLPPVLQTTDGRRLELRGPVVTTDRTYFVGAVVRVGR